MDCLTWPIIYREIHKVNTSVIEDEIIFSTVSGITNLDAIAVYSMDSSAAPSELTTHNENLPRQYTEIYFSCKNGKFHQKKLYF